MAGNQVIVQHGNSEPDSEHDECSSQSRCELLREARGGIFTTLHFAAAGIQSSFDVLFVPVVVSIHCGGRANTGTTASASSRNTSQENPGGAGDDKTHRAADN